MDYLYWIVLLVVFILVEIFTQGLTSIWLAGGALAALIADLLGAGMVVQIVLFLLVSAILLVFTRPFAKKYVNGKTVKTNAEGLIGMTGRVTETIDNLNSTGTVFINGLEWMARTQESEPIPAESNVTVVKIEGVKLIVKKTEGGSENVKSV